jgi:hypothetical protein
MHGTINIKNHQMNLPHNTMTGMLTLQFANKNGISK